MDFLVQKAYAYSDEAGVANGSSFAVLINKILTNIVNPIVYLIMALAIVYFFWGVFQFVKNADSADKRQEGYQHMIWGIVGIFIMLSAKGIINIILSTLGL